MMVCSLHFAVAIVGEKRRFRKRMISDEVDSMSDEGF